MSPADEVDEAEIKEEPDDDRNLLAFAPSAPPAHAKGSHRLFPAGLALEWDAPTSSPAMQELVRQREQVFMIQRQAFEYVLRIERSEDEWAAGLAATGLKGTTKENIKYAYNAWLRFCDAAGVPHFPISFQLVALCTLARSSAAPAYGACPTFVGTLERFKDWTGEVWEGHDVLRQLDELADGEAALRAFMGQSGPSRPLVRPSRPTKALEAPVAERCDNSGSEDGDLSGSYGARTRPSSPRSSRRSRASETADPVDLTCPDLPLANQSFDTLDQLLFAVVRAVFFVYGSACRLDSSVGRRAQIRCSRSSSHGVCPFLLDAVCDSATGRWSVDSARSATSHNHKCDPRYIADPTWRPALVDEVARAAVGLVAVPRGLKRASMEDAPRSVKKSMRVAMNEIPTRTPHVSSSILAPRPRPPPNLTNSPLPLNFARPSAAASALLQHPFHGYLVSYLEELDASGRLVVLAPYLLANGVDSISKVLALVDDSRTVRDMMARILRQAVDGDNELNDVVFEFTRLVGA